MLYKDLNKNHRNPFYLKHQQKKKIKKIINIYLCYKPIF